MSGNGTLVGPNIVKHDVNLIILCNLPNVLCNIYWRNFDFINVSNENSDKNEYDFQHFKLLQLSIFLLNVFSTEYFLSNTWN